VQGRGDGGSAGGPVTSALRRWLPLLLVFAVLLGAGLSARPVPEVFPEQDKLHHLLGFLAFGWALLWASPRLGFAGVTLAGLLLAGAIEAGQAAWLPARTASPWDALAGLGGVWLGWACWRVLAGRNASR
jgi:VanZ family protein